MVGSGMTRALKQACERPKTNSTSCGEQGGRAITRNQESRPNAQARRAAP
eukprot:CAMPEP_0172759900 /NCGR_PEP_ID=MMETSP1074-20121228/168603_1 /TAXON_ID=2916 /ORGANISM="Ceratium fusus, Strain PA161109" /LENGTH=49 /DNA_ID= /DNA_START= /DNA_END= /DNA_ORIENTATION=